MSELETVPGKA